MRAGTMREFLTFLEYIEEQTPSGAIKKSWVEVYSCRGILMKALPSYDKDGVNANEIYNGATLTFRVRNTSKINESQRLRYRNNEYEIILIYPNHEDNSLQIQVKRRNV